MSKGVKRRRVMWAIMSREGHNNIEEHTLSPLRYEAWMKFFSVLKIMYPSSLGMTRKSVEKAEKKIRWYKRNWKAVKVTLTWKVE